jgi:lipoyl(octanoyl) transferase
VDHVRALEEINLRVAGYGIAAGRVDGFSGVWVDDAKVTAIGVRVTAGYVTSTAGRRTSPRTSSDFGGIVPCGITDKDGRRSHSRSA